MSMLSAATGKDASNNASKAQSQAATYNSQAAPLYSSMGTQGQGLTNLFNQQFPGLLSMFEGAAGLPNTVGGSGVGGSGQAGSQGLPGATAGASGSGGTALGNTASGGGKAPTPQANTGQTGTAQQIPANLQQYAAANPTFNPYQLNPDGQAYLSAQIQQMDQNTQATISQYQTQLAQMGIEGSSSAAAGATYIQQQAEAQKNQFVSSFMLQQQQQEEAASASLLQTITGIGQQGAQETAQGAGGLANLGGTQLQFAQGQQQLANTQTSGLGSFLGSIIAPAASNALSGGSGAPIGTF